jgi:hemerythrin-like domain-containing protein
MSQLIEELKSEHVQLKQILKKAGDFTKPAVERIAYLSDIKKGLLAHLGKEDRELYPLLRRAGEQNQEVQRILDVFAKDMEEIAPQALAFFEKYEDVQRVSEQMRTEIQFAVEFGRDLERLMILLGLRIGREEASLYPQFDKTIQKAA